MPKIRPLIRPMLAASALLVFASGPLMAQTDVPAPDAPPPPAHGKPHPMPHHGAKLTVTGDGRSTAAPDLALITLGVSTEAVTAVDAMSQNATRQQAVIDALKADGVEARDIQTSGLNLQPKMEYIDGQAPKLVGYVAQNTVNVRVRDIAGLGGVLDKLVATGANEISGISFAREDMTAAQDDARNAAVAEARRKAQLMAEAAGMRLGDLRALSDAPVFDGPQPMMAMRSREKADATPIEAGELNISARVSAVFDLLPAEAPEGN